MSSSPMFPNITPDKLQASERLMRLETYLTADPGNQNLLVDAFETAVLAGLWERAEFHLGHGLALAIDPLAWALREGDLLLAQGRLDDARDALRRMLSLQPRQSQFATVVAHNLAFIEFRIESYSECVALLAPLLEGTALKLQPESGRTAEPLRVEGRMIQRLWLRALHRTSDLERAWIWTLKTEEANRLDYVAAGIASLIAIDFGDFNAAQRWVMLAQKPNGIDEGPVEIAIEMLITRSNLALGAQMADDAIQWANEALKLNPEDGRALSSLAFALMLKGDLSGARESFNRSLRRMPSHIGTWHGQGWAELMDKDLAGAQATFEHALDMDRNFAESHGSLAVIFAFQGHRDKAQECIVRATKLDKHNIAGRFAQTILDGKMSDAATLRRLGARLLASRSKPR